MVDRIEFTEIFPVISRLGSRKAKLNINNTNPPQIDSQAVVMKIFLGNFTRLDCNEPIDQEKVAAITNNMLGK